MHSSTMSQPRSPQATPSAVGAALKPMRRLPIEQRALVRDAEVFAPAAVDAVEFQQMRGGGRAAFQFVDVHDVEAVVRARIVRLSRITPPMAARSARRPIRPMPLMPTRMAQRAPAGTRGPPPISSSRAFIAMRSSEAKGRLT